VKKSKLELKALLLQIMRPGENVVQTMRRLSGKLPSAGKNKKRTPRSQNGEALTAVATETPDQKLANKIALERFSDITDELLSTGLSGVYDMTYEAIENSAVQWEYRGLDGVIHGPFAPQTIASWKSQGYFTGSSAVMMRKVGVVGKEWGPDANTVNSNISAGASSSSAAATVTESVRGKVRFILDPDKTSEPAAKKTKASIAKADESSAQDLMDDLEEDDDEEVESIPVPVPANPVIVPVPDMADQQRGEWVSSDDVDFETSVEIEEKKEGVLEEDVDDDEDVIR
jgi:GYF domain